MSASLICAIDGENVDFALDSGAAYTRLESVRRFKTGDFPTFTDALQGYTRELQLSTAGLPLGLAVAGVTGGDVVTLANCRWYISVSGLKSFLANPPVLINDFSAIAWSLAGVDVGRLKRIGMLPPKATSPGRRFVVVGTGSGLGMATLIMGEGGIIHVVPGEGGHTSFAPQNAFEDEMLARLRTRLGHVSFERLLAASGLQNIYGVAAEARGRKEPPPTAEAIVASALRGDVLATQAVEAFISVLGSFAGNMVLCTGGFDGVFLVSPLIEAMLPLIERNGFRAAFLNKGRMKKALETVPVSFSPDNNARLYGAAAALRARQVAAEREVRSAA
jgi:glucokinase